MNNTQHHIGDSDELRDFMIVLRQALLTVAAYIKRRYIDTDNRHDNRIDQRAGKYETK